MSKLRSNPIFQPEVKALSNSLAEYWRELATVVNKHESGIVAVAAPAAANSPGTPGQIAYDASYVYICIANDTWKRASIATWP